PVEYGRLERHGAGALGDTLRHDPHSVVVGDDRAAAGQAFAIGPAGRVRHDDAGLAAVVAQDAEIDGLNLAPRPLEVDAAEDAGERTAALAGAQADGHDRPERFCPPHDLRRCARAVADVAPGPNTKDRICRFVEATDAAPARLHDEENGDPRDAGAAGFDPVLGVRSAMSIRRDVWFLVLVWPAFSGWPHRMRSHCAAGRARFARLCRR